MSRVYFGKLPRDCRERDLEKLAEEFGKIRDVRMLQGFAFVEFQDSRDADDCIRDLDNTRFMGDRYISFLLTPESLLNSQRVGDVIVVIATTGTAETVVVLLHAELQPSTLIKESRFWDCHVVLPGKTSRTSCARPVKSNTPTSRTTAMGISFSLTLSVVEFVTVEGKDKAMEMFDGYDYQGSALTIKDVLFHDI